MVAIAGSASGIPSDFECAGRPFVNDSIFLVEKCGGSHSKEDARRQGMVGDDRCEQLQTSPYRSKDPVAFSLEIAAVA